MSTTELLVYMQEQFPGIPWERAHEVDDHVHAGVLSFDFMHQHGYHLHVEYMPLTNAAFPWRLTTRNRRYERTWSLEELCSRLAADLHADVAWHENCLFVLKPVLDKRIMLMNALCDKEAEAAGENILRDTEPGTTGC